MFAALGMGLALAGCSALPTTGPLTDEVMQGGDKEFERRYVVVDLDERVAAILASHAGPSFRARFGDYRPPPNLRIGIGDDVRVTIWEAASGGLFSSPAVDRFGTGSRSALIPDQTITGDGTIGVPYAGRIDVVGRTPADVEATVPMETILAHPAENVFMRPGDILTLVREPQTFTTFGAIGANAVVPFGKITISLEEAIARAGGLQDLRSDPDGIFLLRFESPATVREIAPQRDIDKREKLIPVVYRLTLRDPKNYFVARTFAMRDKDVLYVANAMAVELQKFLTVVSTAITPAATVATSAATSAAYLR